MSQRVDIGRIRFPGQLAGPLFGGLLLLPFQGLRNFPGMIQLGGSHTNAFLNQVKIREDVAHFLFVLRPCLLILFALRLCLVIRRLDLCDAIREGTVN